MSRILVAGAGHGGLTAAYNLARAGHSVTVFEKETYDAVGHDWHDGMWLGSFDLVGMPRPTDMVFRPNKDMVFYNPQKTTTLTLNFGPSPNTAFVDRRELVQYLLRQCGSVGVEIRYKTEVLGCECGPDRVRGLRVRGADGKTETLFGDLVIDAAGIDSPARRSLPARFGITNEIHDEDAFIVYRAYYEKTDPNALDPRYSVYFFHCGHPGMDWMITEEDFMDVLVGKFGSLTQEEIDESIADFKKEYPCMGDAVLRGGYMSRIPLTRTIPTLVANGYAAVGDSAGMTVPLNGCGIDLSLQAGGILASIAVGVTDGNYTKEKLWPYQQRYCLLHGNRLVLVAKLRAFLASLNARNVDFLMESGILSQTEIGMASGNMGAVDFGYVMKKLRAILPQKYLIPAAVKSMRGIRHLKKITTRMPPEYREDRVNKWLKLYNSI
ncbi:MAG: NAD(P)/FAD-dependent oxidoreductase [Clostridia bacterium]|nr:NAD(P)/FAD-dependent oxidoreductase [Clostridia bacterium]